MLYEYRCNTCRQITEARRTVEDRDNSPECFKCKGNTHKIISSQSVHSDFVPYFDDNLQTGIQSKQHRKKVMKEQDVVEMYGKGWT